MSSYNVWRDLDFRACQMFPLHFSNYDLCVCVGLVLMLLTLLQSTPHRLCKHWRCITRTQHTYKYCISNKVKTVSLASWRTNVRNTHTHEARIFSILHLEYYLLVHSILLFLPQKLQRRKIIAASLPSVRQIIAITTQSRKLTVQTILICCSAIPSTKILFPLNESLG